MRLVVAELRLEPVLWVEEDLPVRLPHPVALHPLPRRRVADPYRGSRHPRLEVEEASLDEQLHRGDRELQTGGLHDGLGRGVDEEVLVQLVWMLEVVLWIGEDVCDERIALAAAELVRDWLGDLRPDVVAELRLERVAQVARRSHHGL